MSRNEAWFGLLLLICLLGEFGFLYAYQRSEQRRRDQLPKDASSGRPDVPTRRERVLAVGLGVFSVVAVVWLATWLY